MVGTDRENISERSNNSTKGQYSTDINMALLWLWRYFVYGVTMSMALLCCVTMSMALLCLWRYYVYGITLLRYYVYGITLSVALLCLWCYFVALLCPWHYFVCGVTLWFYLVYGITLSVALLCGVTMSGVTSSMALPCLWRYFVSPHSGSFSRGTMYVLSLP